MSWLHGIAARAKLLLGRRAADARFDRELRFHVEMETERLAREQNLDAGEARRRALVAFGGVERHREGLRDGRGIGWLHGLSLDLRLGVRMLAKYPGLTFVGVLGIAVAVAIGTLAFAAVDTVTSTALPVPGGDRVVAIRNIDLKANDAGRSTHLHDLAEWRESLRGIDAIAAYRTMDRNVFPDEARPSSVRLAEMTASGFRLTRVAPVRGRYLLDEDEREGAADVVVVGYDFWQSRLHGRADVIGSTLHVGRVRHTVVGVMPKGYAFPVNNQVWTPLRLNPLAYERGKAPGIDVFARLAPGVSIDEARVQLTTIGQRLSADYPRSHENIRPRIMPYTRAFLDGPSTAWLLHLGQVLISLLLVVIGTNVGVLVYARTASRAGELAVRTALGASRRRLVAQLFAEALVLSTVASLVGIIGARVVFGQLEGLIRQSADDQVPYWVHLELTPAVVLYVAGLAVLAAVIIGVVPGLKATRARVSQNLKDLSGASVPLGRGWAALLVAQVAVSVAVLPVALSGGAGWIHLALLDIRSPATASVMMVTPMLETDATPPGSDDGDGARRARYVSRVSDLARTLEESGLDVVMMSSEPGGESGVNADIERSPAPAAADTAARIRYVATNHVDSAFFGAFGVTVLAGRTFEATDFAPAARGVIVNQSFVRHFLGGANALGQRVRPVDLPRPGTSSEPQAPPAWEIVGVVTDFPALATPDALVPRVYLPLRPTEVYPLRLAVRGRRLDPAVIADHVRDAGMQVDPTLRFRTIRALEDLLEYALKLQRLAMLAIVMVALSVVLLSTATIYALMSFTVTRRRREIGIRSALGARSSLVLAGILSGAMRQVGLGIAIGVVGAGLVARVLGDSAEWEHLALQLVGVALLMVFVSVLASIGPARRALRVPPTEALRAD